MDKMGSYEDETHSNRGIPARYIFLTFGLLISFKNEISFVSPFLSPFDKHEKRIIPSPRDGSAVELVALQYSVLQWIHKRVLQHQFPFNGVDIQIDKNTKTFWSFGYWCELIESHFHTAFIRNSSPSDPVYYKDLYQSSNTETDNQLRPNYVFLSLQYTDRLDDCHGHFAFSLQIASNSQQRSIECIDHRNSFTLFISTSTRSKNAFSIRSSLSSFL